MATRRAARRGVRIGAHASVAGGLHKAFARAEADGAGSLQVFLRSARSWAARPLAEEDVAAFRAEARRTGLPVIAHGSYLVNLATEQPELREKSLACVLDELGRCERLGVSDLVLHPGSHPDTARGLALVAAALDELHAATRRFRTRICLEVTAGQGNTLGWRLEHLEDILQRVQQPDRLAVCLDTCHLHAAGYELSTPRGCAAVLDEADRRLGLQRVTCLHLNDCRGPRGCRVDRHEDVGKGTLGLDGFRVLLRDARLAGTVGVLETPHPERYGEGIRLLESLAGE